MSTIGMMEGAFFVGRKEIMDWINSTLDLNLSKVEDTANGAVACQLLDIMYPGKVPMSKVNWNAKQSFEFVANYKILQTCFTKLNIERHIDVDRLISGKYMDNLEFMQWFKRFYEMAVSDKGDYDAYAQRSKGKGGNTYNGGKSSNGGAPTVSKPTSAPAPKVSAVAAARPAPSSGASVASALPPAKTVAPVRAAPAEQENHAQRANVNADNNKELVSLRQANQESTRAYAELRTEMEGLEKERDFYFEKLRDIEIVLQDLEDKGEGTTLSAALFKILYATADGFEPLATSEEPTKSVDVYPESVPYDENQESY